MLKVMYITTVDLLRNLKINFFITELEKEIHIWFNNPKNKSICYLDITEEDATLTENKVKIFSTDNCLNAVNYFKEYMESKE